MAFLLLLLIQVSSLLQSLLAITVETVERDVDASYLLNIQTERHWVLHEMHHRPKLAAQPVLRLLIVRCWLGEG